MEFLPQCVYDYKRANVIVTSNKHNGPPSKPQLVYKRPGENVWFLHSKIKFQVKAKEEYCITTTDEVQI